MIQKRKIENKKRYDKKNVENLELKRNDLVLLINDVRKKKFDNKYSGPFRVEERVTSGDENKKEQQKHNCSQ